MSTTTKTLAEPGNGATVVIRDQDGDTLPVQRDDAHPTASGDARWLYLTWPEDRRAAEPWAELAVEALFNLGEPVDPATAEEPADGAHVVVKRVNTKTNVTYWYTVRREDDKYSTPDARWHLEQDHAEGSNWGDWYGNFMWAELGIDGFSFNTVTVYPIVEH
jgi:hypothetical protein